jgi:hypothetical protein
MTGGLVENRVGSNDAPDYRQIGATEGQGFSLASYRAIARRGSGNRDSAHEQERSHLQGKRVHTFSIHSLHLFLVGRTGQLSGKNSRYRQRLGRLGKSQGQSPDFSRFLMSG